MERKSLLSLGGIAKGRAKEKGGYTIDRLNKLKSHYLGLEALIAAIVYTVMGGNIQVGALRVRLVYLIIAYLALKYFYQADGRLSIGVALGMLVLTAISLVAGDQPRADWAAQTAYTFLVIGVLWQIGEMVSHRKTVAQPPDFIEAMSEEESRMARRKQQKIAYSNDALYWRRRGLVLAAAALIILAVVFGPGQIRKVFNSKKQSAKNSSTADVTWERSGKKLPKEKKPAEKVVAVKPATPPETTPTIQVLNGNGLPKEADNIASILEQNKIGDISTADLAEHNQLETVVRYQSGRKDLAEKVAKLLATRYPAKLTEDLDETSSSNIIVALGLDKLGLVDKTNLQIAVKNANGKSGAAAAMTSLLKQNGFANVTAGDAGMQLSGSRVRYNYTDIYAAKVINDIVGQEYQSSLESTSTLAKGTVTVILGLK